MCQGAWDIAGKQLCKINEADGNPALVHDISSQDKERYGQKAEHGNTGKYPLCPGKHCRARIQHRKDGADG